MCIIKVMVNGQTGLHMLWHFFQKINGFNPFFYIKIHISIVKYESRMIYFPRMIRTFTIFVRSFLYTHFNYYTNPRMIYFPRMIRTFTIFVIFVRSFPIEIQYQKYTLCSSFLLWFSLESLILTLNLWVCLIKCFH